MTTLYVRGVPEHLTRAAKALAAHRGITLTALVIESLERTVTPGATTDAEPRGDLRDDEAWYDEHRDELASSHPDEYVAIVDREVVAHGRELAAVAAEVRRRFGSRPVLMPRCVPGGRTVELRSPHLTRR